MLVSVELAKQFLHLDQDDTDDDGIILIIIKAAEEYLFEATKREFTSENSRAVLFLMVLITHWYENREMIGKTNSTIDETIRSLKVQLIYGDV